VTEYREISGKGDCFRGNLYSIGDQIQGKLSREKGDRFQGNAVAIGAVTKTIEKVRGMFAPFNKLMHHRCKHT
jgi:hypothetical protein